MQVVEVIAVTDAAGGQGVVQGVVQELGLGAHFEAGGFLADCRFDDAACENIIRDDNLRDLSR